MVQQAVPVSVRARPPPQSPSAAAMQPRSLDANTLPSASLSKALNNDDDAATAIIVHDHVLRRLSTITHVDVVYIYRKGTQ